MPTLDLIWDNEEADFIHKALAALIRDKEKMTWEDILLYAPEEVLPHFDKVAELYVGLILITENSVEWVGESMKDADPSEIEMLQVLQSIPGYPYSYRIDLAQIREWKNDFPTANIIDELKNFRTWMRDNQRKMKKQSNFRLRFRNWLKKSTGVFTARKGGKNNVQKYSPWQN